VLSMSLIIALDKCFPIEFEEEPTSFSYRQPATTSERGKSLLFGNTTSLSSDSETVCSTVVTLRNNDYCNAILI
jgi:hypothetical protein